MELKSLKSRRDTLTNKCIWCGEEIPEDDHMCFNCSYEAMDDIEREQYNHAYDDESEDEQDIWTGI